MRKTTTSIGKWAEELAATYLLDKGYEILHRNWRAERGDIDIIALDGKYLVFIEVKGGSSRHYGAPELRITNHKKRQLYKLATIFIQKAEPEQYRHEGYRFDVVIVDGFPGKYDIRLYQNAFYI